MDDDWVDLRPGRIGRDRRAAAKSRRFVSLVSQAVQKAGGRGRYPGQGPRAKMVRGRGGGAALRSLASDRRRVVVKARVVRHQGRRFRAAALPRHIRYLEREGVTRDGADAHMFDARSEAADVGAFAERCADDRHHFRLIVSPEDAVDMADLRAFTRDLMAQAERDLITRLDWVAVDHWNTDNPHVHVLVRGRTEDGSDLVIAPHYISRGLRERAEALVTLELGPRTERDIVAALERDVVAERVTPLDRALRDIAERSAGLIDLRRGGDALTADLRAALVGRATALERFGLAEAHGVGRWTLHPDHLSTLQSLSIRGDIIKTMHQAMSRGGRSADPGRFALHDEAPDATILGRLVDRGLDDELKGSAYAIVDGVDGRQHHLRFSSLEAASDARLGAIVELRTWKDRDDTLRMGLTVRSDLDLPGQVTAQGATWLDRQLVSRHPVETGDGFGAEVRQALAERRQHHLAAGHAEQRGPRIFYRRALLQSLREDELGAAIARTEAATGLAHAPSAEGEAIAGVYRRRLDLASGRFAMIDDGLGFQLVPWRPALEAHGGAEVTGVKRPDGGVDWSFARPRGLGL
ncbi:type VI secretion protein [Caulobacter vibrioides]|nr:type VI secretion protein [Caulobacter vibrioides]